MEPSNPGEGPKLSHSRAGPRGCTAEGGTSRSEAQREETGSCRGTGRGRYRGAPVLLGVLFHLESFDFEVRAQKKGFAGA